MTISHNFDVYDVNDTTVNGGQGTDADFTRAENIHTIQFTPGSVTTLTVEDNTGDRFLKGDDNVNEQSGDNSDQTVGGVDTYVDYELVFADANGNHYTVYVIDVGESPNESVQDNVAESYLTFDPNNPPPEGVELFCVSWKQTPKLAYDDFEVPCFALGTVFMQPGGIETKVEDIEPGMYIRTTTGAFEVLWVGNSIERDATYSIYHPDWGQPVTVTKNHGVAVKMLDGSTQLAAAKFLPDGEYGDFLVARNEGSAQEVFHVMLSEHCLIPTKEGLVSESYYCGGWDTIPEAQDAYTAYSGREEMELTLPRVKRRDAAEILDLKVV